MIPTDPVILNSIIKFKEKCLIRNRFTLPAIYPEFVQESFANGNIVNSVVKCNNVDFQGSGITIRYFINFLLHLNDSIVYEVGNDYHVNVFYSLDFEERWDYFTNKFIIDEHESLVEIKNISECMVISFRCINYNVQEVWDKIYKVVNKDRFLLDTYHIFTEEMFPGNSGVLKI